VITEEEIHQAINIIKTSMEELPGLKGEVGDKVISGPEKDVGVKAEK
jgi:hypothetical protein